MPIYFEILVLSSDMSQCSNKSNDSSYIEPTVESRTTDGHGGHGQMTLPCMWTGRILAAS